MSTERDRPETIVVRLARLKRVAHLLDFDQIQVIDDAIAAFDLPPSYGAIVEANRLLVAALKALTKVSRFDFAIGGNPNDETEQLSAALKQIDLLKRELDSHDAAEDIWQRGYDAGKDAAIREAEK